ncbi:MAG: hypothetical protein AAF489_03420 [Bacteroidota bacterium]
MMFLFVITLFLIGLSQLTGKTISGKKFTKKKKFPSIHFSEKRLDSLGNNQGGLYKDLLHYRDSIDIFYLDHFALERDLFVQYRKIESDLYGRNPLPGKVVEGADNWMFLGDNFSNALSESLGHDLFEEKSLIRIEKQVANKRGWLDEKGISYYVAVAPNKLSIYRDKLPIKSPDTLTKAKQLFAHFAKTDFPIIDLSKEIRKHKEEELYYRYDSHWNDLGAYWGYFTLISELKKDYPQIKVVGLDELTLKREPEDRSDLIKMLKIKRSAITNRLYHKNSNATPLPAELTIPSYYRQPAQYEYRYKSDVNNLKVLLLGDSFSNALKEFLKESFGELVMVRDSRFDKRIIEREQPDIVINEFIERDIELIWIKPVELNE